MGEPDIISVNEIDFEYQVLTYSELVPVLVDFWAQWSTSCQRTSAQLETLAQEHTGRFRLAKVEVDNNPILTERYQVHTVPTLKSFQNGLVTHQVEGIRSNLQLVDFVNSIVPGHDNLLLQKAESFLNSNQFKDVEDTCLEVLLETPENAKAKLMLAKALIWQGEYLEALTIINHFPVSVEYQNAEKLKPLVEQLLLKFDQQSEHKNPLDAVYFRTIDLIQRGNIAASLDGLLEILKIDKKYRRGMPKDLILGLFELMGDDHPLVEEYRAKLANTLF